MASVVLQVTVPRELSDQLQKIAESHFTTVSRYVRGILAKHLEELAHVQQP